MPWYPPPVPPSVCPCPCCPCFGPFTANDPDRGTTDNESSIALLYTLVLSATDLRSAAVEVRNPRPALLLLLLAGCCSLPSPARSRVV